MLLRVRVSLLYNQNAGDGVPLDHIRDAIEQRGHHLVGVVEKHADFKRLLDESPEIVVAAGGDGTVALAARLLARRSIPLAILPLGTANNIAKSAGIEGSIDDIIAGWHTARRRPLDIGVADGGWGRRHFVEAVGGGLIPTAIVENELADERLQLLSTNLQIPPLTVSASWLASPDTVAVERVAELAGKLAQANRIVDAPRRARH